MAARRLLIVMLLLLGISTLAAALVPPPEREEGTESSTSTRTKARERSEGERVAAEVSTRTGARPDLVRVSEGDQLALVVKTPRPTEVAVPAFGLIEFAEPGAPARFDILVDEAGRFEVTARGTGTVGTIGAERRRRQP